MPKALLVVCLLLIATVAWAGDASSFMTAPVGLGTLGTLLGGFAVVMERVSGGRLSERMARIEERIAPLQKTVEGIVAENNKVAIEQAILRTKLDLIAKALGGD